VYIDYTAITNKAWLSDESNE